MIFQDFDLKAKKLLLLFLSLLLCWWLFFAPGTASASAPPENQTVVMYQITESELTTLENNLVQLSAINSRLQVESDKQKQQLEALQAEVKLLQNQLRQSAQMSEQQENSLTNANKLLEEYAIAAKKERLRIKAQRNTWEAIAACLVVALAVK